MRNHTTLRKFDVLGNYWVSAYACELSLNGCEWWNQEQIFELYNTNYDLVEMSDHLIFITLCYLATYIHDHYGCSSILEYVYSFNDKGEIITTWSYLDKEKNKRKYIKLIYSFTQKVERFAGDNKFYENITLCN